jgi:hypothetical protein
MSRADPFSTVVSLTAGPMVRIRLPPAGSQYKPEFVPQVAGLGRNLEVVERLGAADQAR